LELFQKALKLMKACSENCDASCYRCLRSFKNKFEHRLLDRHVGAELVEYLLSGSIPMFDSARLKASTTLLYHDLLRQAMPDVTFTIGDTRSLNGRAIEIPILATDKSDNRHVIALAGPLANNSPADADITKLAEHDKSLHVIIVNELLVRGNLPAATRDVLQRLGH
jgi:hypothetical protein